MAWPFDGSGDDSLITGLLGGMKFRAMQEDLQRSRLERAEWEALAGHRELMTTLEQQLAQSRVRGSLLDEQIQSFNLQRSQELAPLQKKSAELDVAAGKLQVKQGAENLGLTKERRAREKAEAPVKQATDQVNLLRATMGLGGDLADAAAFGNRTITAPEIEAMMDQMGVPKDQSRSVMGNLFVQQIAGVRKEKQDNDLFIQNARKQQEFENMATTISRLAQLGPGVDALQGLFPDEWIKAAKSAATQQEAFVDPAIEEALKLVNKDLGSVLQRQADAELRLADVSARVAQQSGIRNYFSGDQSEYESLTQSVQDLKKLSESLKTQREKISKQKQEVGATADGLVIGGYKIKVPADASDDQLRQYQAEIKNKLKIDVTIEQLRKARGAK